MVKSSTGGNFGLKRIVAQQHNLGGMRINHFGHVVLGGYAFVELVQTYQPSIQGNFYV